MPKPFFGWAMIDSGASACFIHKKLVRDYRLPVTKKKIPRKLRVIDGREIASGKVEYECTFQLRLGNHKETIECNVVNLGRHDIVLGISWLKLHKPNIDWAENKVAFTSNYCTSHCVQKPAICIGGRAEEIASLEEDMKRIPQIYHHLKKVFAEGEAVTELPPHRPYDLAIELNEQFKPGHGPIYKIGETEETEMKKTIEAQLAQGLIRRSKSSFASPVLFVKKKNGKLRMCVDYRRLNTMVKRDHYPLPLPDELIERLRGAKIFSKLDLKWGYNLVRIREGDEWKTSFKCKFGQFEYLVMPFGLTNAPAAFQCFMNEILQDLLGICVVVYLDDILIFSKTWEEHEGQVQEVLR
ncbi:Transposon Tf2-1 polyprotein [Ceratobasidium theobromae]|uniref:Transposon Tf2-1 polyprotein n=1 Tax=Ceratobasidium theobromae TaxID=1582974 RepID=A0A5N5Q7H9_9AGAM|nr:Transposon Tf2-1 polyprotein [Ceratobasidium theobromae]